MKWFKHLTNAHSDERLVLLLQKFGPSGYGTYFYILELCGAVFDSTSPNVAWYTCSLVGLKSQLGFYKTKGLLEILNYCGHIKLLEIEFPESDRDKIIKFRAPRMAKIADETANKKVRIEKNKAKPLTRPNIVSKRKNEMSDDQWLLFDYCKSMMPNFADANLINLILETEMRPYILKQQFDAANKNKMLPNVLAGIIRENRIVNITLNESEEFKTDSAYFHSLPNKLKSGCFCVCMANKANLSLKGDEFTVEYGNCDLDDIHNRIKQFLR